MFVYTFSRFFFLFRLFLHVLQLFYTNSHFLSLSLSLPFSVALCFVLLPKNFSTLIPGTRFNVSTFSQQLWRLFVLLLTQSTPKNNNEKKENENENSIGPLAHFQSIQWPKRLFCRHTGATRSNFVQPVPVCICQMLSVLALTMQQIGQSQNESTLKHNAQDCRIFPCRLHCCRVSFSNVALTLTIRYICIFGLRSAVLYLFLFSIL